MQKLVIVLLTFFSIDVFATPVNINTADAQTIASSLTGIGLKKAEAIVNYRDVNGAFKSIDDLLRVSGIGNRTLEKNKVDILFMDSEITATLEEKSKGSESGEVSDINSKTITRILEDGSSETVTITIEKKKHP